MPAGGADGENPTSTTNNSSYTTYTVQSGNTLSGIAYKYGVTVSQLQQWNNISNPNVLYVGQVLRIYTNGSSSTSGTTSSTGSSSSNSSNSPSKATTSNSPTLSQLKQKFLSQLNKMSSNNPSTSGYTTQQMVNYEGNSYENWDNELTSVELAIQENMTQSQKVDFRNECTEWDNTNRLPLAKSEKSGKQAYINNTKQLISITKERCYYLVNRYM